MQPGSTNQLFPLLRPVAFDVSVTVSTRHPPKQMLIFNKPTHFYMKKWKQNKPWRFIWKIFIMFVFFYDMYGTTQPPEITFTCWHQWNSGYFHDILLFWKTLKIFRPCGANCRGRKISVNISRHSFSLMEILDREVWAVLFFAYLGCVKLAMGAYLFLKQIYLWDYFYWTLAYIIDNLIDGVRLRCDD